MMRYWVTDAHWWARVVQGRTQHDDLLSQRAWVLRKDSHEVAIELRAVPGVTPHSCDPGVTLLSTKDQPNRLTVK